MDRSKFIAGLAGPVILCAGISMLFNRGAFPDILHQVQNSLALIILSGVISLAAGLAIVQTHTTWSGWPSLVTLLGWLLVIGGVARMLLPRQLAEIAGSVAANPSLLMTGALVSCGLGAFLTFKANS